MTGKSRKKGYQKIPPTKQEEPVTRKRGRPPGAKNKPKDLKPPTQKAGGFSVSQPVQRKTGRGRPKGSKNKPKEVLPPPVIKPTVPVMTKRRGRPPGAKNKIKAPEQPALAPTAKAPVQSVKLTIKTSENPVILAVQWLKKHMHPTEIQWYQRRANKLELSLDATMAQDLLSFFNVQDNEIKKQVKEAAKNL